MAMEKVSLSLPSELLDEARQRAQRTSLSAYVADGIRRHLLADRQADYLAELDQQFGALSNVELDHARELWNDGP